MLRNFFLHFYVCCLIAGKNAAAVLAYQQEALQVLIHILIFCHLVVFFFRQMYLPRLCRTGLLFGLITQYHTFRTSEISGS